MPINQLRATQIMRENISALLSARKQSQSDLASWLRKDKSWINKFLNGHRQIQLKDLDRIADFFGLATFQLFQPGISPLTERRRSGDRRSGHDRRVGHSYREMRELQSVVHPPRAGSHEADQRRQAATLRREAEAFLKRIDTVLSSSESGRQDPTPRAPQSSPRPRRRAAGRSDVKEA